MRGIKTGRHVAAGTLPRREQSPGRCQVSQPCQVTLGIAYRPHLRRKAGPSLNVVGVAVASPHSNNLEGGLSRQYLDHIAWGTQIPVGLLECNSDLPAHKHEVQQQTISALPFKQHADLTTLQTLDPIIGPLLPFWKEGEVPGRFQKEQMSKGSKELVRQRGRLEEREGVRAVPLNLLLGWKEGVIIVSVTSSTPTRSALLGSPPNRTGGRQYRRVDSGTPRETPHCI